MAITVTAPDSFYECEPWAFELTLNQPGTTQRLDLTGSRLFVRFQDLAGRAVGTCDSAAVDGSLIITNAINGVCQFYVTSEGRTWRVYRPDQPPRLPPKPATLTGDLYRYPPGSDEPEGVATIVFTVLPSTGLPSA